MKSELPVAFDGTSAPTDAAFTTGNGSIIASIITRGMAVSRHTPQGSLKPFGQDTGTADDNTAVEVRHETSNLRHTSGTAIESKEPL
jgi:hypothetical protein